MPDKKNFIRSMKEILDSKYDFRYLKKKILIVK